MLRRVKVKGVWGIVPLSLFRVKRRPKKRTLMNRWITLAFCGFDQKKKLHRRRDLRFAVHSLTLSLSLSLFFSFPSFLSQLHRRRDPPLKTFSGDGLVCGLRFTFSLSLLLSLSLSLSPLSLSSRFAALNSLFLPLFFLPLLPSFPFPSFIFQLHRRRDPLIR